MRGILSYFNSYQSPSVSDTSSTTGIESVSLNSSGKGCPPKPQKTPFNKQKETLNKGTRHLGKHPSGETQVPLLVQLQGTVSPSGRSLELTRQLIWKERDPSWWPHRPGAEGWAPEGWAPAPELWPDSGQGRHTLRRLYRCKIFYL